jgi:hypothetical protein
MCHMYYYVIPIPIFMFIGCQTKEILHHFLQCRLLDHLFRSCTW